MLEQGSVALVNQAEFYGYVEVTDKNIRNIGSALDKFQDDVHEIKATTASLQDSIARVSDSIETIEARFEHDPRQGHGLDIRSDGPLGAALPQPYGGLFEDVSTHSATSPITKYAAGKLDVQAYVGALKDSLTKHMLPPALKVAGLSQTFQKEDSAAARILRKCRDLSEVSVKLLSTLSSDTISQKDLEDLMLIQIAQIKYLAI